MLCKFLILNFIFIVRSSRPEVFCKKGVLRNFTKFTGKHLCQSPFFNKVEGLRPSTLLKMRLWHRCFPVNFVKFLRTPFFIEHLWWLLLYCFRDHIFVGDYMMGIFQFKNYPNSLRKLRFLTEADILSTNKKVDAWKFVPSAYNSTL